MFYSISKSTLYHSKHFTRLWCSAVYPDLDHLYKENTDNGIDNIKLRKGVGDINRVLHLYSIYKTTPETHASYQTIKKDLLDELRKLPNKTHPAVLKHGKEPHILGKINESRQFVKYKPLEFSEISRRLNLMRTDQLGHTCGHKSYYFIGELAELEEALIKYTVTNLLKENFNLVSVPDILPSSILQSCGMPVNSERTQIYSLDQTHHGADQYLSGTAEMSLAGSLQNMTCIKQDLPMKLAAVSRCYRAETSNVVEERGIYRVHQFTKVEMFIVTEPDHSDDMLEYLRNVQEKMFTPLGFHMRVLDMPPHELGAPAYRKYDIEAWMPGRNNFGEISSCSNCTDYQSRRLNIKFVNNNATYYVHTLNGTACAVPRMLIALLETHQDPGGKIHIPEVLQPFMSGKKFITKNTTVPDLKLLKLKKH